MGHWLPGKSVVPSRPAKPGETVVPWGIGFGPVTPNVLAGVLVGQANSLTAPLQVSFGNTPAKLAYSGLAPQSTGLYQFNVVVPAVPDSSAVPLTISLAGVRARRLSTSRCNTDRPAGPSKTGLTPTEIETY